MSNMMQQTIGKTFVSSVVGISRQGLGLVPALLILPPIFGFLGVQMAQPMADVLALVITIPLQARVLRELREADQGTASLSMPKK
jgi:Na+-driven multidrug efflux pump